MLATSFLISPFLRNEFGRIVSATPSNSQVGNI
jgi:hypothetical protein